MRDYNFFEAYQKKRNLSFNIKSPVFLGLIVIVLIIAVSGGSLIQNAVLAAKLSASADELGTLQASKEYQEAVKLQDSIAAMTEYDQYAGSALERINQGKVINTEFLKKLTAVLPSSTNIQSVNLTRVNAVFNINVPNQKAAAELVANLDRSGLFLQTTLASVNSQETGGFVATVNCILKAGDQE